MSPRGGRGQALVEFALLAPVLLVLALGVWDGGGVLREQLILEEAARAGARVAAAGAAADAVTAAVNAGADLPLDASSVVLSYPEGPTAPQVSVTHAHALSTPILRRLWGDGSGTLSLRATAQFYLPPLTPTPLPSMTPSAAACVTTLQVPSLYSGTGAFSEPLALGTRANAGYYQGRIQADWSVSSSKQVNLDVLVYRGDPFASYRHAGKAVIASKPGGAVADAQGHSPELSVSATGQPAGTYTLLFYFPGQASRGGGHGHDEDDDEDESETSSIASSMASISFLMAGCPG